MLTEDGNQALTFRMRQERGTVIIALEGEATMAMAHQLLATLKEVPEGTAEVVLDCAGLHFIDSTGVGTLVHYILERRSHGCRLRLRDVRQEVYQILEIFGFFEFVAE